MKKILICILLLFCLTACDKEDSKDYKKELIEYSSKLTKLLTEKLKGVIKITDIDLCSSF